MNFRSARFHLALILVVATVTLVGCQPGTETSPSTENSNNKTPAPASIVISPGPNAQKEAQEALILAQPGEVIEFTEGKFEFDGTLSIDGINDITVRGKGMDKTILSFANFKAGKGGEGMKVKANNFVIEDLTIEDTPGDAIKLQDCEGLTMRRMKTWWTGGPATKNGAYGLYPVLSTNVLIEHCVAEGASDAGIYVGQSKQVVVRNCRTEENVAGIEIENCIGADVYDNVANNNTGGILVFSLPGLTIKNGSNCRVFNNQVHSNNHPNFAEAGAMVSTVPPGTGLMIMANDHVEVFENEFKDNGSAGCLVVSFLVAQRKFDDAAYDPYSESISIHDNTFAGGGTKANGEFLQSYANATGQPVPDIVIDGILNPADAKDKSAPSQSGFSIKDNGDATFANLDLGTAMSGQSPKVSTDVSVYNDDLAPLKEVILSKN